MSFMGYMVIFFLIGASPGVFCWLRFGLKLGRIAKVVALVEKQEGKISFKYPTLMNKCYFFFFPKKIIYTDDSSRVVRLKKVLIRNGGFRFWLILFTCIIISFVGSFFFVILYLLVTSPPPWLENIFRF